MPATTPCPQVPVTRAVSSQVERADQAEVDRSWEALTDGGEEARAAGSRIVPVSPGGWSPTGWASS